MHSYLLQCPLVVKWHSSFCVSQNGVSSPCPCKCGFDIDIYRCLWVLIHQTVAEIWPHFLFGSLATDFDWLWWIKSLLKIRNPYDNFYKVGLRITCGKFGENRTKYVSCEEVFNLSIKSNMVETLKGAMNSAWNPRNPMINPSFIKIGHTVQKLNTYTQFQP